MRNKPVLFERCPGQDWRQTGVSPVDLDAAEASSSLRDGIIIPGGYAPDHMRRYPEMVKLVRDHDQAGKKVPPYATPVGCSPRPEY